VILSIGLVQGKSYLAFVLSDALPMAQEGWMILTRRLTMMFADLAVGNEIIWRTMSTDAWVKIETFGFPILLFGFLWAQFAALQKYMDLED
jgi:intracellular septation protein